MQRVPTRAMLEAFVKENMEEPRLQLPIRSETQCVPMGIALPWSHFQTTRGTAFWLLTVPGVRCRMINGFPLMIS